MLRVVSANLLLTYVWGFAGWLIVHGLTGWQGGPRKCLASAVAWPQDAYRLIRATLR